MFYIEKEKIKRKCAVLGWIRSFYFWEGKLERGGKKVAYNFQLKETVNLSSIITLNQMEMRSKQII